MRITKNCLYIALVILLTGVTLFGANPFIGYASASSDKSNVSEQKLLADDSPPAYAPMVFSPEQKSALAQQRHKAPFAALDDNVGKRLAATLGGSHFDLLQYLQYTPSERNQNPSCGNCWVWSDTGTMEIALDVQNSVKDRLSIQYFDSNYQATTGGNFPCCGGDEGKFVTFYTSKKKMIPWSNTNASFQDGNRSCSAGTAVASTSISESPSYTISSIGPAQQLSTYNANDATNIANIKNILNQNKAVVLDFYLQPSDWSTFCNWWSTQPVTALWRNDFSNLANYNQTFDGHSVLCVGYDDSDSNTANNYWIMLNSWGATSGRPDGTFRIPMHYNYLSADNSGGPYAYNTYWYTIPVTFSVAASTTPSITNASGATSVTTTSATLNGNLTSTGSQTTTVHIYWGSTDGGTTASSWTKDVNLGTISAGTFSTAISSLTPNATYYYRCAATNASGTSWASGSSSFVAAVVQKLIGVDATATSTDSGGSGPNVTLQRFAADSTGNVTQIRVKASASSTVKVAIYADSSGSPSTLLASVNTATAVTSGWNTIPITSTAVTAGTYYWLSVVSSAYDIYNNNTNSSAKSLYQTSTYSTWTYPNPAGSGWISQPGYTYFLAGWGAPATPATPAITNSTGASNILANTATLNGELTSNGNENPTVHIYWGAADGGTTASIWTNDINLGTKSAGTFSSDISGLTLNTPYYYRCSATNSAGTAWAASTTSFTTSATTIQKLIGVDATATSTDSGGSGPNVTLQRFAADSTGNVTQIRVKASASSTVKVAIYADSSGSPSTLLASVNTATAVTSGWNTIPITSTAVTAGTYYWLSVVSSAYDIYNNNTNSSAKSLYQTSTYSTWTYPNPAGSGWISQPGYTYFLAGWGAPATPATPAITNSTGASNILANTATLNGELTSNGNENPTVHIYWGAADGGTTASSWTNDINLGTKSAGTFSSDISGLTLNTPYYYRCSATNSAGTAWAASTTSFTTSATTIQKLIGVDATATSTDSGGSGPNVTLQRFAAESTGNVTQIRVKASASGTVKVAIYADSSGSPSTLLASVNTATAVTSGWNTITITSTAVTAGTYYWLSVVSSAYDIYNNNTNSSAKSLYQTSTYSTWTYPNPAGSGWISQPGYTYFLAGWGAPATPATPAITNSTGASNILANTATLNGELTSSGNENPTVHIYWGAADGGTTASSWTNDINLGTKSAGTFSSDISGLTLNTPYYYRCSATNSAGTAWAASTTSFTTSATTIQKLIGVDATATSTNSGGSGPNVTLQRFAADSTGNVTQIRVKASASGTVKVAIYADSSGSPSTLLASVNTATAVTSGWNTITITSTAVTAGTYYWLSVVSSAYDIYNNNTNSSASSLYKTSTYSTWTYPNPAGSGWISQPGYTYFLAGWGAPATPATPAITNSTGASNILANTATLNGELTSSGNENPTVHIYWGAADGGTTASSWTNDINLGTKSAGTFSSDISGLTLNTPYYYRCSATNSAGTAWAASTTSFTTSATTIQKLIGVDATATSTDSGGSGPNVTLQRFAADSTGNVTQIRVKASASSTVKVAIYADSSGSPSTLLASVNTATAVTSGWNTIPITSTAVTAGTYYWLSVVSSAYDIYNNNTNSSAKSLYQTSTYSTWTYPNPAGSGWISQPGYTYFLAGWGAPATPATPAITNSTGASNILANTATLNGELTSNGNENPTVHIYWGAADGGTTASSWTNDINLGTKSAGTFSSDISGLTLNTPYYYRCSATNSAGTAWAASTASFTTSATTIQKLIGVDATATSTDSGGSGPNVTLQRFAADSTGNVTQIRVKASASSTVKVAIYADSSGSPSTLLASVNTATAVTSGWNTITITSTAVTAGTYYWLSVVSSAYDIYNNNTNSSAKSLYQTSTYSTWTYPNPAGSGWKSQPGYTYFLAGWGN